MKLRVQYVFAFLLVAAGGFGTNLLAVAATDPLPSWNDGPAKQAIIKFVQTTTDQSSPNFVPAGQRVAEFDQDGTLWVEHPQYTQVVYCLQHVPALVKAKPELAKVEPFKTVLSGNRDALAKLSMREMFEIMLATQSGMTVEQFRDDVKKWLATAKHPRWQLPYTELVYQPMLEVLKYIQANGYKTFIATGGSSSFVREYSDAVYSIPPEQVHRASEQIRLPRAPSHPHYGTQIGPQ